MRRGASVRSTVTWTAPCSSARPWVTAPPHNTSATPNPTHARFMSIPFDLDEPTPEQDPARAGLNQRGQRWHGMHHASDGNLRARRAEATRTNVGGNWLAVSANGFIEAVREQPIPFAPLNRAGQLRSRPVVLHALLTEV